ncbi:hypothetical protein E6R18_15655 [Streptomyces sp. A1277]|uniref:hypothetical protein n=1 Tax=Streptomyces sp. A1277 TaxID=2563103 RepID=UPI0010A244A5|nr:hypothetical protein [Streptomyces sp. A1277]THA31767.1 hypothetical protein E6R18_15655 [Streptomyces sp. A1277]
MTDQPTARPPYRYVDEDEFCLSAHRLSDLATGVPLDTVSITVEGDSDPQSAHVPVGDLPRVLVGIAEAAGLAPAVAPTPDRVTALYDAIDAFQRQHRTTGGLQHAQIRALLAEHLDAALPAAPAVAPTAPPAADQPAPAPLSEVWSVWREDEPAYNHFATVDAARQGTIDFWEEDEPSCPDYSWDQQAGGARLELLVGGVHSGVYASRHPVYGGPAAAPVAEADAELRAEVKQWRATFGRNALPGALRRLETVEVEVERLRADRATTLREAAIESEVIARRLYDDMGQHAAAGARAVGDRLRRLADETQPTEAAPWPAVTTYVVEVLDFGTWVGVSFNRSTLDEARASRETCRRRLPDGQFRIVRWDETATVAETDSEPATAATDESQP